MYFFFYYYKKSIIKIFNAYSDAAVPHSINQSN